MVFSLVYLELSPVLAPMVSSRRNNVDKDVELVVLRHRVRILERQLHRRVKYQPADRLSSPPSAGSFITSSGEPSFSRPGPCSVGTEKPDGGSGERGRDSELVDDRRAVSSM